jgi:DNA-binding Lrp family transcriptional regulator
MAWKGTRPSGVFDRDEAVFNYLREHGPSSRNSVSDALGFSRSLTYLSLDRLRKAERIKRCVAQNTNELLWTTSTEEPCP